MSELKIGDVVRLKSGGPVMTIDDIDRLTISEKDAPLYAWVSWFDSKNNPHSGNYPITSLKIYTAPKKQSIVLR